MFGFGNVRRRRAESARKGAPSTTNLSIDSIDLLEKCRCPDVDMVLSTQTVADTANAIHAFAASLLKHKQNAQEVHVTIVTKHDKSEQDKRDLYAALDERFKKDTACDFVRACNHDYLFVRRPVPASSAR